MIFISKDKLKVASIFLLLNSVNSFALDDIDHTFELMRELRKPSVHNTSNVRSIEIRFKSIYDHLKKITPTSDLLPKLSQFRKFPSLSSFIAYADSNVSYLGVLDEIKSGINRVDEILGQAFNQHKTDTPITIIIGKTAAGKSTVFKHLQGISLISEYNAELGVLEIVEKEKKKESKKDKDIGGGYKSTTTYPSLSESYFDLPGFEDSRGPEQDIINSYSLYKLFDGKNKLFSKQPKFRLVLVIPESDLDISNGRGKPFITLTRQLSEVFSDFSNIEGGLSIVVSHATENNIVIFKNRLRALFKDTDTRDFTNFQKEFFKYLIDENYTHIRFFKKPIKENEPIPADLELVSKDAFYIDYKGKVGHSISEKTREYVRNLSEELTQEVRVFFTSFSDKIEENTEPLIREHNGTSQQLRSSFQDLSTHLKPKPKAKTLFGKKTEEYDAEDIRRTFGRISTQATIRFSNLMNHREFLEQIRPSNLSINTDLNPDGKLGEISEKLSSFSKEPDSNYGPDSLRIRGYIVGTSDVQRLLNAKEKRNQTRLDIYGLRTVLIDSDLHALGINVAMFSPLWKVTGGRKITINLSGNQAADISAKALGDQDGQPGLPGESGGHFYGVYKEFLNDQDLTVKSNGGNGGNGQNGGNGINGRNGVDGTLAAVMSRLCACTKVSINQNVLIDSVKLPFVSVDENRLRYTSGEQGATGGNAGKGGAGGLGGYKGLIQIESDKGEVLKKIAKIQEDGKGGLNGKSGEPGRGGHNGKMFEGIYVEKPTNYSWLVVKTVVVGGIGAGIGTWIGGPAGTYWGYKIGTAAAGAIIGGGAGVLTPAVGTGIDQAVSSGWEVQPYEIVLATHASGGHKPDDTNGAGLVKPIEKVQINPEQFRKSWMSEYR